MISLPESVQCLDSVSAGVPAPCIKDWIVTLETRQFAPMLHSSISMSCADESCGVCSCPARAAKAFCVKCCGLFALIELKKTWEKTEQSNVKVRSLTFLTVLRLQYWWHALIVVQCFGLLSQSSYFVAVACQQLLLCWKQNETESQDRRWELILWIWTGWRNIELAGVWRDAMACGSTPNAAVRPSIPKESGEAQKIACRWATSSSPIRLREYEIFCNNHF